MTTKNLSQFDQKIISILKEVVPDQTMRLEIKESSVHITVYESVCIYGDGISTTKITRNGKTIARVVYNYETGIEEVA